MNNDKTTIYLVRHGECVGNREGRIRGQVDFDLNDNGRLQARAVAEALKDKNIEFIYSSPLRRATDTAQMICDVTGLTYATDEGFNNFNVGIWENRIKKELAVEEPERWRTWLENPEAITFERGESANDVRRRALASLNKVVERHRGHTVAIVAHRGVLKPLVAGAICIDSPFFWRIHFDTASYSILTHDSVHGFCLMLLNYTDHLKGLPILQEFD
ncbi:MAG: histidine phosphatase family protein [Synergistes sp.]|nr:histidine phosphatase family protein [Synergistes sp.]